MHYNTRNQQGNKFELKGRVWDQCGMGERKRKGERAKEKKNRSMGDIQLMLRGII